MPLYALTSRSAGAARRTDEHLRRPAPEQSGRSRLFGEFVEGIFLAMRLGRKRIAVLFQPCAVYHFPEFRLERKVRMPLCEKDYAVDVPMKRQDGDMGTRRPAIFVFFAAIPRKSRQRQVVEPALPYPRLVRWAVCADKDCPQGLHTAALSQSALTNSALMVCIRFSASSKTFEYFDSKTSSVTSSAPHSFVTSVFAS